MIEQTPHDAASPPDAAAQPSSTPGIADAARGLGEAGRATALGAARTATALRRLIAADLDLARHAALRALTLLAAAIALGASAWLLGMAVLVALLREAGLGWLGALTIGAAISFAGTALCAWLAVRALRDTRLAATRRQLARLGIGDDPDAPDAGMDDGDEDAAPAPPGPVQ